jgi:hypothetical protein
MESGVIAELPGVVNILATRNWGEQRLPLRKAGGQPSCGLALPKAYMNSFGIPMLTGAASN